jgi:hypothetical protein
MQSIAEGVSSDVKDILGKAYMDKPVTKSEVTINANVKVEGDENTKNMDKQQFEQMYTKILSDPTMVNATNNMLSSSTSPTATTGAKNQ